ncbi:hypothetical protein GGD56_002701 [Rhizobium mongolense]|uniref:Uncharacterized protein n=1 Tax=Rhizobium mongolense TaxID=57676 RepID=A0ABR6IMW9_9HYPH|nr:hypothetical protein [Rhizobium mongolense]
MFTVNAPGDGGKAQGEKRVAPDSEICDARERNKDEIASVRRNAGDDAHESKDVGQRPARGYNHQFPNQRRHKPGFLGDASANHRGYHQSDRGEAHEIRDERLVHEADAVGVQQAPDRSRSGLDLMAFRIDPLKGYRGTECTQKGRQSNHYGDEDEKDYDGVGDHVAHLFDPIEESLHNGFWSRSRRGHG